MRTAIVAFLREQVAFADLQLFAYVVMPNHLHLVVRQGHLPLWRFMQPLLRRTALVVQRVHGRDGHIFERRYRDHPCGDSEYIRNAIVYTHLNPVRAGLCADPGEYPWSSHGAWVRNSRAVDGLPHPVGLELAAQLFASSPCRDDAGLARDYLTFLNWRRECDRLQLARIEDLPLRTLPQRPVVGYGDESWVIELVSGEEAGIPAWEVGRPDVGQARSTPLVPRSRVDLEHIARGVICSGQNGLELDLVRSRWGGKSYVRARHEIIRRAAAVGYSGTEIAAFLRITAGAVYAVLAAERQKLLSRS